MTGRTFARAVRSLYYRHHLARTIPTIEDTIRVELASRQLASARIGGFIIRLTGSVLSIEPQRVFIQGNWSYRNYRSTQSPENPITDRHLRR